MKRRDGAEGVFPGAVPKQLREVDCSALNLLRFYPSVLRGSQLSGSKFP